MKRIDTSLPGVVVIEPTVFNDDRGSFFEAYNRETFRKLGIETDFVQDNQSHSHKGVLRGLHFQLGRPQLKMVRVLVGEIFDVAVDVRRGSSTFGQWFGTNLDSETKRALLVPGGFAHGFYVLSSEAVVEYKCSEHYAPERERIVSWNDPDLHIKWPLVGAPVLSDKDAAAPSLRDVPLSNLP